jgi:hypothetical protein
VNHIYRKRPTLKGLSALATSSRASVLLGCKSDDFEPDTCTEDIELSNQEIGIVIAQLKRITRSANLEYALRVGAVIIHNFYGGDTSAWRSRGRKSSSLRRLAMHPDLPFSHGSLYRCVAIFDLCERLRAPSRWEHLGASHLRIVLGLSPPLQEKFLATANDNRWTVKALQSAVEREKSVRVTRGGRRPEAALVKRLKTLSRCLEEYHGDATRADFLSRDDIQKGMSFLADARLVLDQVSGLLGSALTRTDSEQGRAPCIAVIDEVAAPNVGQQNGDLSA